MKKFLIVVAAIVLLPVLIELLVFLLLIAMSLWLLVSVLAGSLVFTVVYANLWFLDYHLIPVETVYGEYSMAFLISAVPGIVATISAMIATLVASKQS